MSANSPFLILDGTLHYLTNTLAAEGQDALRVGTRSYAFAKSLPVARLEDIDRRRNEEDIFAYKKHFITEALAGEMRSHGQLRDQQGAAKMVTFLMREVLPLMIDTASDLGQLLHVNLENNQTGKDVMDALLVAPVAPAETDRTQLSNELRQAVLNTIPNLNAPLFSQRKENPRSLLEGVLGENPVYCDYDLMMPLQYHTHGDFLLGGRSFFFFTLRQ